MTTRTRRWLTPFVRLVLAAFVCAVGVAWALQSRSAPDWHQPIFPLAVALAISLVSGAVLAKVLWQYLTEKPSEDDPPAGPAPPHGRG